MFRFPHYAVLVEHSKMSEISSYVNVSFPHSMAKQQQVKDETGMMLMQEMSSLVCRIRFRQASNSDILEAVQLLQDIEEKFPIGTYHPDFEYRKGVILQAAANLQQQPPQQQPQQQQTQQQMQSVHPQPKPGPSTSK